MNSPKNREVRPGYKMTKLGWIPEEWSITKVGQALEIENNKRKPISAEERKKIKGIYPYYGPTKIQDYINEYHFEGKYALIAEDGDHFLKYRYTPMTQIASGKFNVNNHAHVLRGTDICTTDWFYWFFYHRSIFSHLTRQGAGRYKLNKAALQILPIILPPLPEQIAIARILSTWDRGIEKLRQLIAAKQQRKKGLMQVLLTGKKRLKGFEGEWKEVRLEEVAKIKYGKDQKGVIDNNGKYPIYGTGGLMGFANDYLYDKPSVLIGRKGTIDKPRFQDTPFWTVDTLFYTEISQSFNPRWVYFKFLTIPWRKYNEASGVPSLAASTISKIKFKAPLSDEQYSISNILSKADKEIEMLEQKLSHLHQQKKGLMQKLLMGEVRVKIQNGGNN